MNSVLQTLKDNLNQTKYVLDRNIKVPYDLGMIKMIDYTIEQIELLLPIEQSQTEALKKEIEELRKERFKKPETKQLIDMAILFNEGVLDKEKLSDMLAYAEFIIDRLHENGHILIPSKNED